MGRNTGYGKLERQSQGLTEVRSGCVNVQSLTGVSYTRLEWTRAFSGYHFDADAAQAPWIPLRDWNRIAEENFAGCDVFSIKIMASSAGYANWQGFERAIWKCGSLYHFVKDGPIYATAASSHAAGPAHLKTVTEQKRREGQERGFLLAGGPHLKK
jgi:hypothetical protein